jgi:hypothetical protein
MRLERELLEELRRLTMAITQLDADIATLSTNVGLLIAQGANSVPQAQVDAADAVVNAINATVVAALTPVTKTT